MYLCPRYNFCNAPICPLDPNWTSRVYVYGDEKCKLGKGLRQKLGKNLPNKGLKFGEFTNSDYWKSLTDEERVKIKEGSK